MCKKECYDVIIAGSGVAGLHTALCLDRRLSVLVLSKREPDLSNSALAQGGVAAVLDRENDSEQLHCDDTMTAGGGTNNPKAVDVLVREGPGNVLGLLDYGVDFDRNADGALNLTLEGGHSRRRIAHHRDTSGYELVIRLLAAAKLRENIELAENAAMLRLERGDAGFYAGILQAGEYRTVRSRYFVMATGGVGMAFQYTTNSAIATGDGIAAAQKLGARIRDLSLVQFHPTAFAGVPGQQRFLISESVRGEGAILLNRDGERFMKRYDGRGELAPRDVVSKAIREEALRTGSEKFYLDITHEDPEFVRNRFPAIYQKCLESSVDITKDRIPVFPCQHYLMGGIDVDTSARTTLPGLYAVGECSHTGVHGSNRLASNSLLEALVFSRRAAEDIMGGGFSPVPARTPFRLRTGRPVEEGVRAEIQDRLQRSYFIVPEPAAIRENLPKLSELADRLENGGYADSPERTEAYSLAAVAKTILTELLDRPEVRARAEAAPALDDQRR